MNCKYCDLSQFQIEEEFDHFVVLHPHSTPLKFNDLYVFEHLIVIPRRHIRELFYVGANKYLEIIMILSIYTKYGFSLYVEEDNKKHLVFHLYKFSN